MALTKIPSSLLDTSGGFDLQGNITLGDSEKVLFGADSDLQIYHDGNHSYIYDNGTGSLRVLSDAFRVRNTANNASVITGLDGGGVFLYHDGNQKLETTSTGATLTGTLVADGIKVNDSENIKLGTDDDLQLFFDGTNSFVHHTTSGGSLKLKYVNTDALIVDSSANVTIPGTLTVTGNLDITGDINSYNVTDLDVTDQTITLGAGQTEANSGGSGIIIDGSGASILWDETNTEFDINNSINVTGDNKAISVSSADQDKIAFLGPVGSSGDFADEGLFYLRDGSTITAQINSNGVSYFNGGNVGIGEDNPNRKLNLLNQSGNTLMKIQTNAAGYAGIDYENSSQLWYAGIRTDVANSWAIKDETNTNVFFQVRPSSGRVGIGLNTDAPRKPLHVRGNESGAQVVEIEQDNAAGIAGMHFSFNDTQVAHLGMAGASYTGNSNWTDRFFIGTITDKEVVISQNDEACVIVDTNQDVIIGSGHNSSTPGHAIIKAAAASGFNNTGGDLRLYGGTSTGDNAGGEIEFYTGAAASSGTQANTPTERMRIDADGNVGIGATPTDYYADNLVVNAGTGEGGITIVGASNQWNYLLFADGTSGDAQYRGQIAYNHTTDKIEVTSSGTLSLKTGSSRTDRLNIDSSGNVGIGETNPTHLLHLKSNVPTIKFTESDTSTNAFIQNTGGNLRLYADDGNSRADTVIGFHIDASERATIDDKGIKQYNRFVSGTLLPTAFVGCDSWYDLSGRYSTVVTSGNDLTSCTDASGEGRSTLIKNTVAVSPNNNATKEQFPSGIYGFRFDQSSYITGTSHTSGYVPPTGTNARTLWCIIYNFQEITAEPLNHFLHYGTNSTGQAFGIAFTPSSNTIGMHSWAGNGRTVDLDTDIAGGFTNNGTTPRDVYVLFTLIYGDGSGNGETRVYRGGMEGVSDIGSVAGLNTGAGYALHVGSRINANGSDESCDAVIGEFGAFSRKLSTKEMDLLAHSLLLRWS